MADGLLSDADVGLAPTASQSPQGLLSDADVGIVPTNSSALTNSGDEGMASGAAKNVATAAIKGGGDIVGFAGNMQGMADYLVDRGEQGVRYLAGYPKPLDQIQADNAAAAQRTRDLQAQSPIGRLSAAIPEPPSGDQVAAPVLARTGSYEPDSQAGQLAQAGMRAAFGSIGPGGGGVASGTATKALLGTVAKQAPIVGLSGAVGQGVTDQTGDPLLGMVAGNAAAGVGGAGAHYANKVVEPFAEKVPVAGRLYLGTQDRLAGEKLLANASDPAAFQNALSPGPMLPGADQPIPKFDPTTAQLTGDAGLAQAERGDAATTPAPYIARRDAQNLAVAQNIDAMTPTGSPEAVTSHLQGQLASMDQDADTQIGLARQAAQQEASQIGTGAGPELTGDDLRMHVVMANRAAADDARRLWQAVDPDRSLAAPMGGIKQASADIYGNLSDTAKQFVSPEESKFAQLVSGYRPVESFQELGDLRSNLAAAMRHEQATNGSTPVYARLSKLMGTVQSTINSSVEGRAAQEAHAVATGVMAPEDTMEARVQALRQKWNVNADAARADASGSLGRTGTDVVGLAGSGATGGFGSVRTTGAASGRVGQAPSDQGLPSQAPLQPNIDDAAVGRIKAATKATKDLHATYDHGIIGEMLATRGNAGDYKLTPSAVPAKMLSGGPREYDAVQQYRKATNSAAEAELSLHQAYAESARAKTISADGMVDPAKLAAWKKAHEHGLRAVDESVPSFSSRFDNAAKATEAVTAQAAAQKVMREHFQSGIVGKLLGADGEDEIISRFGRIMNADDRVPQINKLLASIRGNTDAKEGLRKTAADWMARQFKTQTEIGSSGEKQVSANAFKKIVADKAPVLARLFTTDEMGNFHRVANALDMQNRSLTSKIAGGPGTAQDMNQAAKHGGHGAQGKPASSIADAAKNGAMLGFVAHGLHGAGVGAATGAFGHVVNTLRSMGINSVEGLYRDALLNPDRARYLLSKVPARAEQRMSQTVANNLRRSFLTAPQMIRQQQEHDRQAVSGFAAGGRVEPTEAQKLAGNYPKGHTQVWGIDITIENKKGTTRSGVGKDGKRWSVTMPADYGYIRKTTGADGDHVDCYLGPRPTAGDAYIVDQHDPDTGKFDEHKVLIGFASEKDAVTTYARGFSDGRGLDRAAKITRIPCPKLLAWAQSDAATKPTPTPARRARGGLVGGGGGPFGVPTYGQTLAPTKKAMSRGLGFSTGGTVPDLPEWASPPGAVERALHMIEERRKAG